MLNQVWTWMIISGVILGLFNGKAGLVTQAVLDSSKTAVHLCIELAGIMCFWTGLMNIAEKSGLVEHISRGVAPVLRYLFKGVPKGHPAFGSIAMNLAANFLGLGNAATPLGIKAMGSLQELNPHKDTATNAMSMFLVLNTSAVQLVPATIIAVRSASGSSNPAEIIGTIWVSTACAAVFGIAAAKILSLFYGKDSR